jgi:phage protein U
MSIIEKFGFGPAAERARFNLKLKKKNKKKQEAASLKPQASSFKRHETDTIKR